MQLLTIPSTCPICGSKTQIVKKYNTETLMCVNPNCGKKIEGRILHFIGAHGLDIESMSIATVRDLIELGWINSMADIFTLKNHRDEWLNISGYGESSVDKILNNIPNELDLWKLIASAGIPNVEKQTAKLLAEHFKTWDSFLNAVKTSYDFTQLNGIGGITAETLSNFDYSEIDEVSKVIKIKAIEKKTGLLSGKTFCITGTLSMKRDDIIKMIENAGGKFTGVSKNLDYLICNDKTSNSGKAKKAHELGIPFISEDEFMKML